MPRSLRGGKTCSSESGPLIIIIIDIVSIVIDNVVVIIIIVVLVAVLRDTHGVSSFLSHCIVVLLFIIARPGGPVAELDTDAAWRAWCSHRVG